MSAIMSFARVIGIWAALTAGPALAADNDVILTITGFRPLDGQSIVVGYNLAELQAMPKTSFTTTTMWTDGPQTFDGVSLKDVFDANGITKGTVSATAINNYMIEIPVSDAVEGGPIIAYALNGALMSVRDKGPLWIVYPYDQNPDYQTEVVFSRSIWQLDRIAINP